MKIKLSLAFFVMLLAFSCSKDATITAELEDKALQPLTALDVKQIEIGEDIENPFEFIREEIEANAEGKTDEFKDCPCGKLDWIFPINITQTSATVLWGFPKDCGYYYMIIHNQTTNTYSYIQPIYTTSLNLNFLDPCSEYEITVGHVGDLCAAVGVSTTFQTECNDYCNAGSFNSADLYIQYISIMSHQHPGVWSADPSMGYIDKTNTTLTIPANTTANFSAAGMCFNGNWTSDVYAKLWIDYNNNGVFELSETVYSYNNGPFSVSGTSYCLDIPMPSFTTPNFDACGVRARFIISTSPIGGPCVTVGRGQVMDFTVDVGNC
jgi:hypothetical protein